MFYGRIQAMLSPGMTVLDVGCGRGAALADDPVRWRRELRRLRGRCERVIGIDVDPVGSENPGLDEFRHLRDPSTWPIDDASVDLILADFVLEHIDDPASFFAEVNRVLKSPVPGTGGVFCARTTNRLGYVGLVASLVPNERHVRVLEKVQRDRKEVDVFPTRYRVNTVWRLRAELRKIGFEAVVYGYEAEPSYLRFSAVAYGIGRLLHWLTPPPLRTCLFVFGRKLAPQ